MKIIHPMDARKLVSKAQKENIETLYRVMKEVNDMIINSANLGRNYLLLSPRYFPGHESLHPLIIKNLTKKEFICSEHIVNNMGQDTLVYKISWK